MRPTTLEVIRGLQGAVVGQIIPELSSSYAQAQGMYSVMLLEVMATHQETAAHELVESNRALSTLLQRTLSALGDVSATEAVEVREALAAADLAPNEASIKLPDLRAEWCRLAELVCRAVPLVERSPSEPGLTSLKPLRAEYLEALRGDVQRRMVPVLGSG